MTTEIVSEITAETVRNLQVGDCFEACALFKGLCDEQLIWTVISRNGDNESIELAATYFGVAVDAVVCTPVGERLEWTEGEIDNGK